MKKEIFKTNYVSYLSDRKTINWTSKFIDRIKKNKFMTILILFIILASCFNFILIFNFIKLLETLT